MSDVDTSSDVSSRSVERGTHSRDSSGVMNEDVRKLIALIRRTRRKDLPQPISPASIENASGIPESMELYVLGVLLASMRGKGTDEWNTARLAQVFTMLLAVVEDHYKPKGLQEQQSDEDYSLEASSKVEMWMKTDLPSYLPLLKASDDAAFGEFVARLPKVYEYLKRLAPDANHRNQLLMMMNLIQKRIENLRSDPFEDEDMLIEQLQWLADVSSDAMVNVDSIADLTDSWDDDTFDHWRSYLALGVGTSQCLDGSH